MILLKFIFKPVTGNQKPETSANLNLSLYPKGGLPYQ